MRLLVAALLHGAPAVLGQTYVTPYAAVSRFAGQANSGNSDGIGTDARRCLTIGSTDFSTTVYNYNMNPDDSTPDYDQEKFSIKHDEDKIIPLIHRAQKKAQDGRSDGEGIRFLSSSWSPPAWMKRPYLALKGHMRNSAKPGMKDDPKIFESYALYLSKYVSAYKAAGIDVEMMTIQNEVSMLRLRLCSFECLFVFFFTRCVFPDLFSRLSSPAVLF